MAPSGIGYVVFLKRVFASESTARRCSASEVVKNGNEKRSLFMAIKNLNLSFMAINNFGVE